jgi:TolB protein
MRKSGLTMKHSITRRSALGLVSAAALAPALARAQQAPYLDIRPGGEFNPVVVAVPGFIGDPDLAALLTGVVNNNFKRSVFLKPIDASQSADHITDPDQAPRFDAWRQIGAQFILVGRSSRGADGRLRTAFRLWDATSGQQVAGEQYVTDANNARRVGHIVSDAVFSRITGEKGFFDTRVVFVDETGPAQRRIKRLALMDQDGANVRYLTRGDELVVTPRFSPSTQDVTYMAFGGGDPRVYLLNIESGQREVVGNFPGMTFSPRFSPDGQKIILSLDQGSSANLYVMDLHSRSMTRLTNTPAIDTSPSYSPDGSRVAFESDRGGTQQIYVMSAGGGDAQRISFGQGKFATPVWSPKGDYIAFTREQGNTFAIGVMKPDGSGMRILSEGFDNEGPTWAPNGLFLMYFSDPGDGGGAKIYMADVMGRSIFPVPTPDYASDPAWSPLLS